MPDADTYRTLARAARAEGDKVRGSRFPADAFPVQTEAEAEAALAAVRRREHAARHHCWAWRLGTAADAGGPRVRYADDGEPGGTAGAPILRQIEARDLTGVLVVVTRYFGGTKLGTGGLARAYGDAAALVLDAAPVEECVLREALAVRFAYDDTSAVHHALGSFDVEMGEAAYGADTRLAVRVRRSEAEALRARLVEITAGRVGLERVSQPALRPDG